MTRNTVIEGRAYTAERIRRAVLTMRALPDPEWNWLYRSEQSAMPKYVRRLRDGDFESAPVPPRYRPTPRDVDECMETFAWLTWLKQQPQGNRDLKVLVARATGVSYRLLAEQFGRSERTVKHWREGAVSAIFDQHKAAILSHMPVIERV